MRSGFPRVATLFVVGATVSLSLTASASAGSATLRVGDVISIGGSKSLGCIVYGGPALECAPGMLGNAVPLLGYGVFISKERAAIVQFRANKDRVVLFRDQPRVHGKLFTKAAKRARQVYYVQVGDRVLLGGSDVACAGAKNKGHLFISCYAVNAKLDPLAGSWGIYFSAHVAALTHFDRAGNVIKTIGKTN